ncbi:branched-chain amino acid ABC transporter permease [Candidatus Poriferisodalis sp.]|uniref:branched-chain amino acid ABC transporter permease n=1 Tax=Candidatus Poriferisodalis sp. TaxID=3101277 RepID=UPI003AF8C1CD
MIRAFVASLTAGASYAIFGICIVLIYRMAGTLNFATTAVGAMGAFSMLALLDNGVPIFQAATAALIVGVLLGAALGTTFAVLFRDHQPLTRSTVTIAVLLGMLAAGFRIFGDSPRASQPFLPGRFVEVAGVRITFDTMIAVTVALVVTTVASVVLVRTRVGIRLRAMSQDAITAELDGVPVAALTAAVWGVAGLLAALGAILVGPSRPPAFAPMVFLLLPGLAAALAGRFERVWPTLGAGFAIAFLEAYSARLPGISRYRAAVPFFLILALLLWQRRDEVWDDAR